MSLKMHKPLVIFLSLIVIFSACTKDADKTYEPPVTEPLTAAAAKPGDTLIIRGENFSEVTAENTVQFNGVTAIVVSASATELKVIIPANATTGAVTVTVHGKTVEVGSLIIAPYTLYCIKGNFQGTPSLRQLVSINPETGSESLVATINQTGDKVENAVYLPATNEIIGHDEDGTKLIKINLTTKQVSTLPLNTTATTGFIELVVDKENNLYSIWVDWSNQDHYLVKLVKLDPKTGAGSAIKSFTYKSDWESLVYLPATNEIVGLTEAGRKLLKLNLTSKDTSTVSVVKVDEVQYRELLTDNKSNLYGLKADYTVTPSIARIEKINAATGAETLVTNLELGKIHDNLLYIPQRKEIVSVWDETALYRLNIDTKASNSVSITSQGGLVYHSLISN
jgi:hypothetical protein